MISRRGFLVALAGLVAAPSLIEKVKPERRMWRVKKVMGEVEFSGELLRSRKVMTGDFRVSQEVLDKIQPRPWFVHHSTRGWISQNDYIVFANER